MSKGEIVEHLGEGQYRVKLKYAVDRVKAEISDLEQRLVTLDVDLPQKQIDLSSAESAVDAKAGEINQLIPGLAAEADGVREQITALQTELIKLQSEASLLRYEVERLKGERLDIRKRLTLVSSIPEGKELTAWCADYSDELVGDVGIVDVNDEGGRGAVIQPGFNGSAAYLPARDGMLMPRAAQSGAQAYFNAALLPGVQKWQPRYRLGTLKSLTLDAGTVELDPAKSSEQGLNINEERTLTDIPIQYMDCNGSVFEVGDRVLVRWFESGPQVVGFASGPRPCVLPGFFFAPASYDGIYYTVYGQPINDSNAPIGEPGGPRQGWILHDTPSGIFKGRERVAGQANWIGKNDIHLSWMGGGDRSRASGPKGREVYFRLKAVFSCRSYTGFQDDYVMGAGYDGENLLVATVYPEAAPWGYEDQRITIHRVPVDGRMRQTGDRITVDEINLPRNQAPISGVYWSADGSRAVMTVVNYYSGTLYDVRMGEQIWKVLVNSSGGHAIEQIYDYQQSIDEALVVDDQNLKETVDRLIPLYVDFAGNDEVTAYWREPGAYYRVHYESTVTENRDQDGNLVTKVYDVVDEHEYYEKRPRAIVLGSGEVLAEVDHASHANFYESGTITRNYENSDLSHVTRSGSASSSICKGSIVSPFGPVAIDVRSKHAVISEGYDDRSAAWSIDHTGSENQGPSLSDAYGILSGPSAGTRTETVGEDGEPDYSSLWRLSAWAEGAKIGDVINNPASDFVVGSVSLLRVDSFTRDRMRRLAAPVYRPESVRRIGSCKVGADSAISISNYSEYYGEYLVINWIKSMGDPVPSLFGKSSDDGYFLLGLTLV